jgi:hypothetical protein
MEVTQPYPTLTLAPLTYMSSSVYLSCLEYILYSKLVEKSSFPCSTCFRVAESIGRGKPIDSKNATAKVAHVSVPLLNPPTPNPKYDTG